MGNDAPESSLSYEYAVYLAGEYCGSVYSIHLSPYKNAISSSYINHNDSSLVYLNEEEKIKKPSIEFTLTIERESLPWLIWIQDIFNLRKSNDGDIQRKTVEVQFKTRLANGKLEPKIIYTITNAFPTGFRIGTASILYSHCLDLSFSLAYDDCTFEVL